MTPVPIGKINHPTDSTAVVLRLESTGGFVAPGANLINAPVFTLYGDNTVVYRPATNSAGTGYPPLMRAVLSAAEVDQLLGFALGTGYLRDAHDSYARPAPDAPTTIFTIEAGGVSKRVSVTGLGVKVPAGDPDAAAIKGLSALSDRLRSFDEQVAAGHVVSVAPYEPQTYRAILSQGPGASQPVAWPWPELALSDFSADSSGLGLLLGDLTAEQAAKVTTVPSGGAAGIGITAPDGTAYSLSLRPLLPGDRF